MKPFDPFSDRMARNIRNSLTEALVEDLSEGGEKALHQIIQDWRSQDLEPVYNNYIEDRQTRYQNVVNTIKTEKMQDPRFQAIVLWNNRLFFELHQLLETIWIRALEPERTGLKGLIQAAGVYVHLHRGKLNAARGLANRARGHLSAGAQSLTFISNINELILTLKNPALPAPQIIANPNYSR